MSADIRVACAHCGEEKLIEIVRETAAGTKLLTCAVCARDTVIFAVNTCPDCGGVNSHEDTCKWMQNCWGV